MALLTASQIRNAKAWLHDVFYWGGLIPNSKRDITNYSCMYGLSSRYPTWPPTQNGQKAAEFICNTLKDRKAYSGVFLKLDTQLKALSILKFVNDLHATVETRKNSITVDAEQEAKYIAWFCSTNQLYWDASNTAAAEWETIKNTISGKALWDAVCFNCQNLPQQKQTRTKSASTAGAGSGQASSGAGSNSQSDWKARGALSGDAIGLIGTPHDKIYLKPTDDLFTINGWDGANHIALPKGLYIRPVEGPKYAENNKCKVYYGSTTANGYCPVFLDSPQAADDFLVAVRNSGTISADLVVTVKRAKDYKGGLFKVDTVFGPVYISASKLNEELEEDLTAEEAKPVKGKSNREKWEAVEEAFFRD